MFKRILILVGVVGFSLTLLGLMGLTIETAPAVSASPSMQAGCIPIIYDIVTNTVWSSACYRVMTSTVTIQPDVILTISPITSTRVEFEPDAELLVLGNLQALGAANRPITFTSASSPAPCSWNGIVLPFGNQGARIERSTIEYACTGVVIGGAQSIQILSNVFRYNGVDSTPDGAIAGITDYSIITGNLIYSSTNGIILNKSFSNQIVGNTIRDIKQYGINFTAQITVGQPTVGGSNNVVANNVISNTLLGVKLELGSFNQVLNNSIYLNSSGAAHVISQSGTIVQSNNVYSNGDGLRLESGSSNKVLSNSIYLNTKSAVYLLGQDGATVQYNYVYSNGGSTDYQAAIYVTGTPDMATLLVSRNLVYDEREDALEYTALNSTLGSWAWNNALCATAASKYELRNDDDLTTDARYNWWGTNTPTLGSQYIGLVNITPWITLSLITATAELPADGISTGVITISLRDALGNTVPPTSTRQTSPPAPNPRRVELTTTLGAINPAVVLIDDNGFATARLTSAPTVGTAIVTATAFCNYPISIPVRFAATNLAITKTAAVTQVVAGGVLTYSITYSNTSGVLANEVRITDTLPAGTTWLGDNALALGWVRVQTAPQIVYTRASLPAGARGSFILTATVSNATCGQGLMNNVRIGTRTVEDTYTDNTASAGPVQIVCADVTITKTTALTQAVPGSLITYTIAYSNVSSAPAYGVVITDVLPLGTRYVADTSGLLCPACVPGATGPLAWSVATPLPPNSPSYSFNLILQVDRNPALCGTSLVNSVSITTTTPENNLLPNSAQTRPLPLVCADVTITKTTALTQAVPGKLITYTIVYNNGGGARADGVAITDVLPLGTRYVADTSGLPCPACVPGATGPLAWSVATPLPPTSPSYSFNLILQVDRNSALCGTSLVNGVSISTLTPESNLANNTGQARPLPLVCADVTITKTTTMTRTVSGGLIVYTVSYSNLGSASAENTLITDTLPSGTRYVSSTTALPCPACVSGAAGPLTWSAGTLPPNSSYSFNLTLQVQIDPTNCNVVVPPNIVVITTATPETNTGNNSAASPSLSSVCPVDLVVIKDDDVGPTRPRSQFLSPDSQAMVENLLREVRRLDPQAVTAHRDFVYEGDLVTYTIAVINNGTVTATNVVLTETLPQYTSYVTGSGWVAVTPITYVLSIGSLPPGAGRVYYFVLRVNDPITDNVSLLTNQVCGFPDTPDANPADNCGYEDTPVRRQPIRISKWAQCVIPGADFSYWLFYTNTTTATYSNVRITDTLPISTTYVGAAGDWNCVGNAFCTWIAPLIYPGTNVKQLPVHLDRNYPYSAVTNTVVISDGRPFVLVTPIDQQPDLAIVKNDNIGPLTPTQQLAWDQIERQLEGNVRLQPLQDGREFVRPGERITYTILYVNNGAMTATHVIVTETLPANTTYVGGGWTPAGGRYYTISLGILGPHQGGQLEFVIQVNSSFPCGESRIVNQVRIASDQSECELSNNASVELTPIAECVQAKTFLPIILKSYPLAPGELPSVMFSSSNYQVWENRGVATITVVLSRPSAQTVTVEYATSNGTAIAGIDYVPTSGTLTFAPGQTSRVFNVTVISDTIYELPETVILSLRNPVNATLGTPNPATLTIIDPCPPTPPSCAPAVWCVVPSEFGPMGMAYDNARSRLFVANQGNASTGGNLTIMGSLGERLQVLTGLSAQGVALDNTRGRNRAYVVGGNWLYVVNVGGATPTVLTRVEVGVGEDVGAHSVAYNPNTDLIYVTGYNDNTVTVISAATWSVLRRMTGFFEPSYTAVNTVTNKVYVSNHTSGVPWGYVSVISGTSKIAPDIHLSGDLYGISVDNVRNRIYVASISAARVYVINGNTDTTMGDIQIVRARDGRQVPLRMAAVNPSVGADTHLWLTSSQGDMWGMDRMILLALPQSTWPPQAPMQLRAAEVMPSPEGGLVLDLASWRVFASNTVSDLVTLSRDNATLCPDPLTTFSDAGQESYYPVAHDYTIRRPRR